MFQSARLKLTAWYVLIIMLISIGFSGAVYRSMTFELERAARMPPPPPPPFSDIHHPAPPPPRIDPVVIEETKKRILFALFVINLLILGSAGGGGYFLAGRTLKPIKEMVDEQNRFITDASHELRTPLTALKTSTEVALRDINLTPEEAKELLRDNLEEINNLQALSDSLLHLAQFERVDSSFHFSQISLNEAILKAKGEVKMLAKKKGITIKIPDTDYTLEADKNSIVELLVILLDNAIKYSPNNSEITILSGKIDPFIVIDVKDQGIGVDRSEIPRIFDRFYRAVKSRSKSMASGYGLGLSIAKKIVDAHNGSITVESAPGKGTTFTIRIPARKSR